MVKINDIQFESEQRFLNYINKALGCDEGEIDSPDALYDVLSCFEDDIELTFCGTENISAQMKPFAEKVFAAVYNAKSENDGLTVKIVNTSV